MSRILLALISLSAGVGAFAIAYPLTSELHGEANAAHAAWIAETQSIARAQADQAALAERVRELEGDVAQASAVAVNPLWAVLQTNSVGHLTPELRERLLEELGFNWRFSDEYIVVSKETLHHITIPAIGDGKLSALAAAVFAVTPGERGQFEATMQRAETDFKDWALTHVVRSEPTADVVAQYWGSAHVDRSEPKDEVVAQYTLPDDPGMTQTISNNFATGVFDALGRQRTEFILPYTSSWIGGIGIGELPLAMILWRCPDGNKQRLEARVISNLGTKRQWGFTRLSNQSFLEEFRPIFPDGWADVAKREGFELPEEPEKK